MPTADRLPDEVPDALPDWLADGPADVLSDLVDLQVNGAGGHDLTEDPRSLWAVGEALRSFGVATFLPTLVSPSWQTVDRAREVLAAGAPSGYGGATPLG